MSRLFVLTSMVLLCLKLAAVVSCPWWVVFAPAAAGLGLAAAGLTVLLVAAYFIGRDEPAGERKK